MAGRGLLKVKHPDTGHAVEMEQLELQQLFELLLGPPLCRALLPLVTPCLLCLPSKRTCCVLGSIHESVQGRTSSKDKWIAPNEISPKQR